MTISECIIPEPTITTPRRTFTFDASPDFQFLGVAEDSLLYASDATNATSGAGRATAVLVGGPTNLNAWLNGNDAEAMASTVVGIASFTSGARAVVLIG